MMKALYALAYLVLSAQTQLDLVKNIQWFHA